MTKSTVIMDGDKNMKVTTKQKKWQTLAVFALIIAIICTFSLGITTQVNAAKNEPPTPTGVKLKEYKQNARFLKYVVGSWNAIPKAKADGYQYRLSYTAKNGKKTTCTKKTLANKTIKEKLSGTKCSLKVRSYKKINGKTVYSKWSKWVKAKK